MMTALFGFLALGTDLGYLYQRKRIMQNAADAGAVYGAQAIKRGNTTLVEDTAWDGTAANGFTNDVDGVMVTVNNPPLSGSYVTEAKAVEVIICQDQLTFFMQVLNVFSAPVCARGVAGYTGNGQGCIYALDESADQAFHVHDSVLDLNCGIVVNSTSSSAMYAESGSDITATSIGVTGDYLYEDATSDWPAPNVVPLSKLGSGPFSAGAGTESRSSLQTARTPPVRVADSPMNCAAAACCTPCASAPPAPAFRRACRRSPD